MPVKDSASRFVAPPLHLCSTTKLLASNVVVPLCEIAPFSDFTSSYHSSFTFSAAMPISSITHEANNTPDEMAKAIRVP